MVPATGMSLLEDILVNLAWIAAALAVAVLLRLTSKSDRNVARETGPSVARHRRSRQSARPRTSGE